MSNNYKNFLSLGKEENNEYVIIPYAGETSYVNGYNNTNGENVRSLSMEEEIHELEISATSFGSSNSNWNVVLDVYIKDKSLDTEKIFYIYNRLIIKDNKKYYNEKDIVLKPNQELCFKIYSITSKSSNNYNISVSASTIEFSNATGVYNKVTINPTPSDALVELSYMDTYKTTSGYIMVPTGGDVDYKVSANHYVTTKNSLQNINTDTTIDVTLQKLKCLTIATNAHNAITTMTATQPSGIETTNGFIQEGNKIWVTSGTQVTYSITAPHYISKLNQIYTVTNDEVKMVNLELVKHTLSMTIDPNDAIVILTADGYEQSGNSITVPYGTEVTYHIEREGFLPVNGSYTVLENHTIPVYMNLTPGGVIFESTDTSIHSISIPRDGIYEVHLVGAGGGGTYTHYTEGTSRSWYQTASGGSGAYLYGNINLSIGTYPIQIGTGGIGVVGNEGESSSGGNGTPTAAFNESAGAGGGGIASGWINQFGTPGPGGTATSSQLTVVNGNRGAAAYNKRDCKGGKSVHDGHGYGGNGNAQSGDNGYIKVTYIGLQP